MRVRGSPVGTNAVGFPKARSRLKDNPRLRVVWHRIYDECFCLGPGRGHRHLPQHHSRNTADYVVRVAFTFLAEFAIGDSGSRSTVFDARYQTPEVNAFSKA